MVNKEYEAYKLKRELKRSGVSCSIYRKIKNDFGEPVGKPVVVGMIDGLYHEDNSHIQITTGETTQTRTKKIPALLCLYKDVENLKICVGDELYFHNKVFKITGVVDILEWGTIGDLSMELIDNGKM